MKKSSFIFVMAAALLMAAVSSCNDQERMTLPKSGIPVT